MNVEELVRESLRELAAEQPSAGTGFADRVLAVRRRRHTRRLVSVAAATTAVVAVAVGVPLLDSGKDEVRPANVVRQDGVHAHPDQSPPRDEIGAGDTVLAAYYTAQVHPKTKSRAVSQRTYRLLDPKTGTYRTDGRWSYVAVAPGMKTAAVLERSLPAHRIGLLDLATGKVARWIPVDRGVGGVAFSRDGSRLVATTYDENPDLLVAAKGADGSSGWMSKFHDSSRSGFFVLDVASGKSSWSGVSPERDINGRQDFSFSSTGEQVYSQIVGPKDGLQQFYDLDGNKIAAPANEKYLRSDVDARLSPNGRLGALGLAAEAKDMSWSKIVDPLTGKDAAGVRGAQLLAWVNDKQLIAWERKAGSGRYQGRLALVTIGNDDIVWLSGAREEIPGRPDAWVPLFARR